MAEGVFAKKDDDNDDDNDDNDDNDDELEEFDRLALDFILVKHKAPI